MKVYLNNKEYEVNSSENLSGFLKAHDMLRPGIAIAVNNRVIPKTEWETTALEPEMKITLIRAVCGG